MNVDLAGKTALVTGAAGGIGSSICQLLLDCGCYVIATDIQHIDLGTNSEFLPMNLTSLEAMRTAINSISRPVDYLVNCAGVARFEPIFDTTESAFDLQNDVNLKAPMFLSILLGKKMSETGGGAIVNVSSQSSKIALADHLVYSTTKAAIDHMTRITSMELGPYGIRVNAVNPTVVMTPLAKKAWSKEGLKKMQAKIPIGRFANPIDVAHVVVYLLSDYSAMVNGTTLHVDGGYWFSKL